MSKQSPELLPITPNKSIRIRFYAYMLNLTPFSTPEWFTDAFIEHFGHPCYISIQCGNQFSHCFFPQFALNTLLKLYSSFTVKKLL